MHRFYLPPEQCQGETLLLTGREAHHAARVLRVRRGEQVVVLDGAGQECRCSVTEPGTDQIRLELLEKRIHAEPRYQVTLIQAIPKGKLIESIIQKATELGVHRIVPLLSERVVTHVGDAESAVKEMKWQFVAIEAIKQCGAPWLPKVAAPIKLCDFLQRTEKFDLSLVGSLRAGSRHPRESFLAFEQRHGRKPTSISVWVGPEGDFTPEELAAIESAGAAGVTFGPLVLRAETAAIYCLSIVNYELQGPVPRT